MAKLIPVVVGDCVPGFPNLFRYGAIDCHPAPPKIVLNRREAERAKQVETDRGCSWDEAVRVVANGEDGIAQQYSVKPDESGDVKTLSPSEAQAYRLWRLRGLSHTSAMAKLSPTFAS
jgi:hypothetical protein